MDALTDVLGTSRIAGSISCRASLRSPWGIAFDAMEACGFFHIVNRGTCWLQFGGQHEPVQLVPGDVVLLPHGSAHTLLDTPGRRALPLAELIGEDGQGLATELHYGGDGPETVLLSGGYHFETGAHHPLLAHLPLLIHIEASIAEASGGLQTVLRLLAIESHEQCSGYQTIADRLVDMLFVYIIRAWLARQPQPDTGWLAALHDPQIGQALCLIHRDLKASWTVESLARAVGMSRAAFARSFAGLTGEPPLAYVTRWRMEAAARLLRAGDEPLSSIARHVGYESEYSFSKAFRRTHGVAPGRFRRGLQRAG